MVHIVPERYSLGETPRRLGALDVDVIQISAKPKELWRSRILACTEVANLFRSVGSEFGKARKRDFPTDHVQLTAESHDRGSSTLQRSHFLLCMFYFSM